MNMLQVTWKCIEGRWGALLIAALCCATTTRVDAANLTFIVGATNGVTNSEVVVPIQVRQFTNVSSFQFSFHWNTNIATYVGVERFGLPGLTNNNESFGTPFTPIGTLTVAWFDPDGGAQTFADDGVVFGVRLRLIGPAASTSVTTIDGTPTAIDAGDESLNHLSVSITNGVLSVDHTLLYLCPNNKTVECGTPWGFDLPVVFDSCNASTNGVSITVLSSGTNVTSTCGYTATRTWEIVDQCANRTTCSQLVTVIDTTPPVVSCAGNKSVEFGLAWNFDAPIASDACTATANLVTRIVSTDTNYNGFCGPTFAATRIWQILDGCSNSTSCTQTVTLRDTTTPQITCAPSKIVNCLASWSFDTPTAIDVASGSNIPPVIVSTVTTGTCGNNFSSTRTWSATDACGNSLTCSQVVLGRALVDVSGTIFTPTNYPATISDKRIPGATLLGPSNTLSAVDGTYHNVFDAANNVVITPGAPGGNPPDGVTTLDISLVRRHILSVTALDNPYKFLGADVDGSGSISTLDLSFMRRLILGTTNRFPLGLWRFIPANHAFIDPLNPWNPPTNRAYANVAADIGGQDYVAIKLGDVNTSWTPPLTGGGSGGGPSWNANSGSGGGNLSTTPVTFTIGSSNGLPGSDLLIPVFVRGFTNVNTFQFSLHWNTGVVTLLNLEQFDLAGLTAGNFGISSTGRLSASWDNPDPANGALSLPDRKPIFYLKFRCSGSPSNFTSLTLDGNPTPVIVTDGNDQEIPVTTENGQISIDQPSRAPSLANITDKTVDEETTLSFTASATDIDVGETLTFTLDPGAPAGASIHPATGVFTWTPTEAQGPGTFPVTVRVTDNGNPAPLSDTRTFTIHVNEVNTAPVASSENYNVNEDTVLNMGAPGVLVNDSDADADTLTAVLVNPTANGTLTLNPNGSFTYRPATNFHGSDSFTYQANDGLANSPTATVTITVNSVNDAPVALNDSLYSIAEDTSLLVPATLGVLTNDFDPDDDFFNALLVNTTTNGTLTLQPNGGFGYTPNTNFNGLDHFTYRITDGIATSVVAVVTITVTPANDAPIASGENYTTDEDVTLTQPAPGVLANDNDIDGDTLTAMLVSTTTRGTLTLNANGSFNYAPGANLAGNDSFTYRVTDGQATSAVVTATITVRSVNDAPVALADLYSVNEDAPLHVNAPGVRSNDSDAELDALTVALVTNPTHGTLTLNSDGSFDYSPVTNFNGTDSFIYRASDGQTTSPPATVTINVAALNDAPMANNDSYSTDEDTTLVIGVPGVLSNDTDVDGDTLTVTLVSPPANGSLSLNANGSFSYTPVTNFNGSDSFTYQAADGVANSAAATVTITVRPVNDAPIAADQTYTLLEDSLAIIPPATGVLSNAVDADNDRLTALLVTTTTNGTLTLQTNGAFTYLPSTNFNGTDHFSYRVSDGTTNSAVALVTITVLSVNDIPLAGNDSYSIDEDTVLSVAAPGILANDSVGDGQSLTAILVGNPVHGALSLNANGSFTYTPATNYFGPDSFTYRANDGVTNSPVSTVNITVRPINDVPIVSDDTYATLEDTTLAVPVALGVLTNDFDPDVEILTALLVSTTTNGALSLQTNGSFVYVPDANFNGVDHFIYRVTDGVTISGSAVVTINVTAVNDSPLAADDNYSTAENVPLAISAPGVLANDSDVEGSALTAVLVSGVSHGVLSLNANGSFNYSPAANYNGADSFSYRANDGAANSGIVVVNISVTPVNTAPVANADNYSIDEDTVLTVNSAGVLNNDTDPDGDALNATLVSAPSHGALSLNPNGSFTYTPASNFDGSDSFTYRASDGELSSANATVSITVISRNDPPVLAAVGTKRVKRGSVVAFTASASDPDSQVLTFSIEGAPAGASIDPTTGLFSWMADVPGPKTNWVTVRVTDNGSPAQSATVAVPIVIDEVIHISIADVVVPGGSDGNLEAVFDVTLSAPSSEPVSVEFTTVDNTAVGGADYVVTAGTLIFSPGETNQTIDVTVVGSSAVHSNRSFFVHLGNPTNAIIDQPQAIGLITSEPATGLSMSDVVVTEPTGIIGNAMFTVSLWPPSDKLVTVKYATSKGSATQGRDFKAKRGTLKFLPGQTNLFINVPIAGDTLSESNETFFITLSKSVNAVIATPRVTGTIIDDDPLPFVRITDVATTEIDAGARGLVFTVQLSVKSGRTITVDFATTDDSATAGSDYIATNGTLVFPPKFMKRKFIVPIMGDKISEGSETFIVNLLNTVNGEILDGQAVATIRDDDAVRSRAAAQRVRRVRIQP